MRHPAAILWLGFLAAVPAVGQAKPVVTRANPADLTELMIEIEAVAVAE